MNGAIIYYILTTFASKSTPNITFWTCTCAVDSVVSDCIRIYVKLVVSIWFRNHRGGWGNGGNYLLTDASDWRLLQRRKWIMIDWLLIDWLLFDWLVDCLLNSNYIQLFPKRLSEKVHATIPKGIAGGFEITALHRNFEKMAREAMDYVSEC